MHSQNTGDESLNFSVIDKNQQKMPNIDFSVEQLLQTSQQKQQNAQNNCPEKKSKEYVFKKMKQLQQISMNKTQIRAINRIEGIFQNNFLKDLQKMEKELSFQTQEYNIYEDNPNNSGQVVSNNKSKTISTLKFTKQSKSISKYGCMNYNEYFGDLIIDFKVEGKPKVNRMTKHSGSSNQSKDRVTPKSHINSKNKKNSGLKDFFRSKQKDSVMKSHKFTSPQQLVKRSKSKSLSQKMKNGFKSPKAQKIITQNDDISSKVCSQYYVSETNFTKPIDKQNQTKKKKSSIAQNISSIKSKDKIILKSKSKTKINVLSPRGKKSIITVNSKK